MSDLQQRYLGDGVYADYDGFQVILTVDDFDSMPCHTHTIYLEPDVLSNLAEYMRTVVQMPMGETK